MRKHWLYLLAVLRHKFFVYREGRTLGLGRWQMLIHDWSKFTPRMWTPYAASFYGNPGEKQETKPGFRLAWLWHQKMEPHHWQYWIMHEDSGKEFCLEMPRKYMLEMCADWRGANRAYGDMPLMAWYSKTMAARKLHPDTQAEVERVLFGHRVVFGPPSLSVEVKKFYGKATLEAFDRHRQRLSSEEIIATRREARGLDPQVRIAHGSQDL